MDFLRNTNIDFMKYRKFFIGFSFAIMAIGAVAGAGAGALSGSLADYGIRDDFIKKIGETIPNGSSALCVLFRSVTEDKVVAELEPYKPRVLKTSLSTEQEARLRSALDKLST